MNFNFSPAVKLKSKWQFDIVFRTGRRETGELVRLLFIERPSVTTQVGVTVGKKIAKAHMRTRGRRILREAYRRLLPWMVDGVWAVASLRANALDSKADEVYCDLAHCMKKRGLLRDDWPGLDWNVDSK